MFISKLFLLAFVFSLQTGLFASDLKGKSLPVAADAALLEASFELGERIYAWEATVAGDEIVTNFLTLDDIGLSYGCHLHGADMACHLEGNSQGVKKYFKDPSADLKYVQNGNFAAIKKFEKSMKLRKKDLDVMSSYKVWPQSQKPVAGHESSTNVWTKINYNLGAGPVEIFILCHVHGGSTNFSCHYRQAGQEEPMLDFIVDDSGDNNHGDDDDHSGHDHGDEDDHDDDGDHSGHDHGDDDDHSGHDH